MANVKVAVNHVVNDKGETVIAIGAPGSVARAKVQWPALIENLNRLYASAYESHGRAVDEAIEMIRAAGVKGRMETDSILMASDYSNETPGSITSLVRSIDGTPPAYKGTWARSSQMTKKQASSWVQANCVFARNERLVSMVKEAASSKGVELTEQSLVCLAAHALVYATLKVMAALPTDLGDLTNALKASYESLAKSSGGKSPSANELADAVLTTILKRDLGNVGNPQWSQRWRMDFPKVMAQAQTFVQKLSKEELAGMWGQAEGVGANPTPAGIGRTRLTPPKPTQSPRMTINPPAPA